LVVLATLANLGRTRTPASVDKNVFENARIPHLFPDPAACAGSLPELMSLERAMPVSATQRGAPRTYHLGTVEKEFVRLAMDHAGGHRVFLGVQLRGPDVVRSMREGLSLALNYAQVAHPVLACVLVRDASKELVLQESSLKIDVTRYDDKTWEQVFQERARVPLALNQLPLRAFYCCASPDQVDLIIQGEHHVLDGTCLPMLVHQILGWCFGTLGPPSPGRMPIPEEVAVERTALQSLGLVMTKLKGFRLFYDVIAAAITHDAPSFALQDAAQPDADMGHTNSTFFVSHVLSEADTKAFLASCKQRKITVTSGVTACFLEAEAEILAETLPGPFQLSSVQVTSIRHVVVPKAADDVMTPYLGNTSAHYTGKVYGRGARGEGGLARVCDVAKGVGEFLRRETVPERLLLRARLTAWGLSQQPVSATAPALIVSSWSPKGPIQARYAANAQVVQARFSMNVGVNAWPTLAIYTVADRLHVCIMVASPRFSPQHAQRILDGGVMWMHQMALVAQGSSPIKCSNNISSKL
jgi:hypothetical protein